MECTIYYFSMTDATTAHRISRWCVERALTPAATAVLFVVVALLWTFPLQHVIAYPFVFLFFGAIMGSAWFGGITAGVIAVFLSSVLIGYFFIPPFYSMSIAKESQSFFTAFILCAIAIMIVSSARKRAETTIREARDQLEGRVRERTFELERSNQEIQERERQLRQLTEAIPQQIWRADADGNVEYCNRHLIDYLGQARSSLRGGAFFSFLHPEDESLFRQGWQDALKAREKFEAEARICSHSGTYMWFLVRAVPQLALDGTIARWYGIHIDIEEQHRAQQSLARAQEQHSRISHLLSMAEMAASIAHELNQPMTAVVTHAYACREWLRDDTLNVAKASETAEKIVRESTRASAVVGRVRSLFRKEGQVRELTEMNELIREVARLLRDEAIRRDISIRLIFEKEPLKLHIDPVQIQQVILNLAMNGMEAMAESPEPRDLTIRILRKSDDETILSVEDHGAGIPAEISQEIFKPFVTTKADGTGMGLAICRSIVEMHDGRIWAENRPAGGSTFYFSVRNQA